MDASPGLSQNSWLPPLLIIYSLVFPSPYTLGFGRLADGTHLRGLGPHKPPKQMLRRGGEGKPRGRCRVGNVGEDLGAGVVQHFGNPQVTI